MATEVPVAHVDIRPEDIEAVSRVLASGNLRQGQVVAEFEGAVAARVGAAHAVAVSSGTAALHLTYLALFKPGDEVIVPAFTFVATASMLLPVGAVPVFADVDPRTFCLSVEDARRRITERTRGIVGVHLFGNACDIDALTATAREYELTLVWDGAQSLGTEYRGRDVSTYPTATCHSFYPTKNVTTGEGGMITTDDADLASRLRLLRSQGAAGKYLHTTLGFNYRLTDFQAALGLKQLGRLDEYIRRRQENARLLTAVITGAPGVQTPYFENGVTPTFNQYTITLEPETRREEVIATLTLDGIQTAVHYPRPLHKQPLFGSKEVLAVSDRLSTQVLSLPVHPGVGPDDIRKIGAAVHRASVPRDT